MACSLCQKDKIDCLRVFYKLESNYSGSYTSFDPFAFHSFILFFFLVSYYYIIFSRLSNVLFSVVCTLQYISVLFHGAESHIGFSIAIMGICCENIRSCIRAVANMQANTQPDIAL